MKYTLQFYKDVLYYCKIKSSVNVNKIKLIYKKMKILVIKYYKNTEVYKNYLMLYEDCWDMKKDLYLERLRLSDFEKQLIADPDILALKIDIDALPLIDPRRHDPMEWYPMENKIKRIMEMESAKLETLKGNLKRRHRAIKFAIKEVRNPIKFYYQRYIDRKYTRKSSKELDRIGILRYKIRQIEKLEKFCFLHKLLLRYYKSKEKKANKSLSKLNRSYRRVVLRYYRV